MSPRSKYVLRFLAIALVAMVIAQLLDHTAYTYLYDRHVYDKDWGRMLRVMGFLPVWILAALALALHERPEGASWRAGRTYPKALLLFASPTLAGIAGELLKLVIRRERPWAHAGAYVFRPFSDRPFYSGGLSMPSSHTTVAFGAAFILCRLYPRATIVWVALATGCALTRVAAHAHFLSDVTLGAIVSWVVAELLWRRYSSLVMMNSGRPSNS